ncbi:MAG: hypothetical protein PHU85_03955 [Phycisphaerae bacterium]|nr:hypothetical protein [Phycisphaerae bacterium]
MPTATANVSLSVGGIAIAGTVSRTAEGQTSHSVDLAQAKAGTLSTRTDDDTGIATLSQGHGIISTDVVDVYWAAGVRYGMVATVTVNAVALEGGAGDVLPTEDAVVNVCKQTPIVMLLDGDTINMIGVVATLRSHADFQETGAASAKALTLPAGEPWWWASDLGITNPFASTDLVLIAVSNGDATATSTVSIGVLVDSVV